MCYICKNLILIVRGTLYNTIFIFFISFYTNIRLPSIKKQFFFFVFMLMVCCSTIFIWTGERFKYMHSFLMLHGLKLLECWTVADGRPGLSSYLTMEFLYVNWIRESNLFFTFYEWVYIGFEHCIIEAIKSKLRILQRSLGALSYWVGYAYTYFLVKQTLHGSWG